MNRLIQSAVVLSSYFAMRCCGADGGNRSLAFVFDTTASMRVDYEQFKNNVQNTMEHVWGRKDADVKHFVFVPFNDPDVGDAYETVDPARDSRDTSDLLRERIGVRGGGDCPEMSLSAAIKALEASNHDSHVFLFTDASPKDPYLIEKALGLVQRKRSRVVVLNTGENCLSADKSYERIASLGFGHVFDVCKNDVSKILKFLRVSAFVECKANLAYVNNPLSKTVPYPVKVNVDKSITDLMMTVSGLNAKLNVVGPGGGKNDGKSGNQTVDLDLQNVRIVSVKRPAAGEWILNVTSESPHSVRACGISKAKDCVYGFATKPTKTMSQTGHRPLADTKNYVLVDCPDAKRFSCCKLLGLNGDEIAVVSSKFEKNLLSCGPFKPKNSPFYVQVCGTTENGDFFKRISTSVIPARQDKPYVKTPKNVFAAVGGEARINCRVESPTPFAAEWRSQNSNVPIKTSNFSHSSEFELLIGNVTEIHFVNYTCSAHIESFENGRSESTTTLLRETDHTKPHFEGNHEILDLFEGEDRLMECKDYGTLASQIEWFMNNSKIASDDDHFLAVGDDKRIIYDARLSDSNAYACRASSAIRVTENRFDVTVKRVDTASPTANESLTGKLDSTVVLPCRVPNDIRWLKDNKPIEDERGDVKRLKQTMAGFRISYLRESDAALYTCVNGANETYAVDLQVEFEPYFAAESEPESLKISRNRPGPVVFDCGAKGFPKLKVKWRKNNKPLTRWHYKDVEFLENEHKIKIHPADARDWVVYNGTYSCTIKNKLGTETRNFDLIVI